MFKVDMEVAVEPEKLDPPTQDAIRASTMESWLAQELHDAVDRIGDLTGGVDAVGQIVVERRKS